MHKHDYEALAMAIKENTAIYSEYLRKQAFINALCDILAADNPKFNKEKFLEAIK